MSIDETVARRLVLSGLAALGAAATHKRWGSAFASVPMTQVDREVAAAFPQWLAEGLRFPEGPVAMADGSVIVVEIAAGRVSRVGPHGERSIVAVTGGGPNGAALGPDGCCYICNNGGFRWLSDSAGLRPIGKADDYSGGRIEKIDLKTGKVTPLYTRSEHGPLGAPNDLVFDRGGGFWFTDPGVSTGRTMDRGGVFYARPDGSLIRQAIFPMLQPNGIALSPKEDVLYVTETVTGRLWAFDIEAPGRIRSHVWPSPNGGRIVARLPGYRLFDSIALDIDGNIVAATIYEGGIVTISPKGAIIDDLRLPDRFVTNVCFGGKDRRSAYITLSQTGRLAILPWRRPGLRLNFS
ncbi:MAG: SMP-30/gluconolactonase/LRE family protein [Sphingomonadales bacterium]|nr:SMP-30/gluconolactonase/LRE family protein [Sphingomonadales bacterium]